jgi:ABC-2 type transport system ATP-binding protein
MSFNAVIETRGLTHNYGKVMAVKGVNLDVCEGEIFGFLGPNGAGKTTTIRMILDFIRPTRGSINVLGMDSRQRSVEIRRRVGYLPSELTLWENWTGTAYIRWLEKVYQKPLLDEAHQLAERLQFKLERPLRGMSTGMKRKMGLIAALSPRAELLILDEPTNGLDPLMQQVFNEMMREARAEGRTVFLSSHMLAEVEQICDRVGIIRGGQLKAVETVDDLTHVSFRWLTLNMNGAAAVNGFDRIEGVSDVTREGSVVKMRVSGSTDMNQVVRTIAQHDITDMQFVRPNLEEVFLAFYGEKEQ